MIRASVAGCSCCCVACEASVIARCARAVGAWLTLDSLAVVFLVWRTLASQSRGSQSSSLLVLAEVRFPQNCVVLVSGCCCIALYAEVHRLVALCSRGGFPELFVVVLMSVSLKTVSRSFLLLPCSSEFEVCGWFGWCVLEGFSQSGALVVLVEVLSGSACVASVVLLAAVFSLMVRVVWSFGLCILVKDRPLSLLVEVLPRSASCLFRATVVLLLWFEVCRLVGLCSGEVLPERLLALLVEVLPRAASRYFDGGLVSAIGVWRAVLLVGASVSRCGFASRVWKRLVRVSFLCFSLVARGGDPPLWCCVAGVRIVATFWWSYLPLSCFGLSYLLPSYCRSFVAPRAGGPVCAVFRCDGFLLPA
ncbi:hypothetical protein Taro_053990 [Colocasia esculenta]|uniref:Uncharacterized protein n=1 Tax=Colocasia esculenta TaxID=4460 RepID=A0A843XPD8_COLES|nr:hypothetical protein [Colocasia esculenta]